VSDRDLEALYGRSLPGRAHGGRRDLSLEVVDRTAHALAAEAARVSVAKLDGLVEAGRCAGRHRSLSARAPAK
jgi:hypothetical protein